MAHESISLDALSTFAEVAKQRSFSGAAKSLHVTPSAVSHRIADLERILGVELFSRTTRRVRLSDPGRDLLASVQAGLDKIHEGLSKIRKPNAASLTVSCSTSFAIRWLLPRVSAFRQAHPELEVHIAANDEIADPRREDIDICVRYGAGKYAGVAVERLAVEHVFPVCSVEFQKRHRLTRPEQLTRLSLLHHDVLREHPGRVDWPRWFERAGLDAASSQRGSHFSHAHMALTAALAGDGIALGRTSLVADDLKRRHLVMPFGPRVRSGLAYWLVTDRNTSAKTEAFAGWIRAEMRRRTLRGIGSRRGAYEATP